MQRYFNTVTTRSGDVISGALVTVKDADGNVATIYSDTDGATEQDNPISTDSNGFYGFYAADGTYSLTISGPRMRTRTIEGVALVDISDVAAQVEAAAQAAAEAAGNTPDGRGVNVASYATLRAYAGDALTIAVTGYLASSAPSGVAGFFTRDDDDTTSADDEGTIIVASNGKRWKRIFSGPVDVRWFGAKGDGSTNDTSALRLAITAAGVNGTLLFAPGDTYIVAGGLTLLEGQTVIGYGAKIKRISERKSATATAISTGSSPTAITVSDGTQFSSGMDVTVYSGSSYDPSSHRVSSVVGNVVTVGTAFSVAFPSGGTLITVGELLNSSAAGVKVLGLEVDGNRSNNTSLAKWDTHAGVFINGDYSIVRDCYIHDEVSEGIEIGGDGGMAENNSVVNCGGNGIHFSGSSGGKAIGNYVYNTNILGTAPGHADGGICFSDSTGDSIIANNYVDTAICGVASIDTNGNSSVVISGNIVKNCTTYAVEGVVPTGELAGKVTIIGNRFYDSGTVEINSTNGSLDTAACPYSWIVANNYLENTRISISKAINVDVHGNQIICAANTTQSLVSITASQYVSVQGNRLEGGLYAVGMSGSYLKIHGNTCKNQYSRGLNQGSSGTAVEIHDNTIIVETGYTTNGSYQGMQVQNGTSVFNNRLDITVGSGSHGIYCPSGGASVSGAFVQGNVIRSSGMTSSIRTDGGSQNNVITANFIVQAISNAGGASNTVSGNFTIF